MFHESAIGLDILRESAVIVVPREQYQRRDSFNEKGSASNESQLLPSLAFNGSIIAAGGIRLKGEQDQTVTPTRALFCREEGLGNGSGSWLPSSGAAYSRVGRVAAAHLGRGLRAYVPGLARAVAPGPPVISCQCLYAGADLQARA
jgi:hypothetical protein